MSVNTFVDALDPPPAATIQPLVRRVLQASRADTLSDGEDPFALAMRAELPVLDTLAALGALLEAHMGRYFVRVTNPDGEVLKEYGSLAEVEPYVRDEFNVEQRVEPEHTFVLFRGAPALIAYLSAAGVER
jgi:hypothetical protein